MSNTIYIVESGKVDIQAQTGLLIFNSSAISQDGFENIEDAISWIESRYGSPKRVGEHFIWQSALTNNAYRIRFINVVSHEERCEENYSEKYR